MKKFQKLLSLVLASLLLGQEARELADYVVSISSSLPYGVKELSYFDI